tara:strand:- start:634 stop:939 length:306 start_codon:yes stop_codon:yes gene_type:complete
MANPITWSGANFTWGSNEYTWGEVQLVAEVAEVVQAGGGVEPEEWLESQPEKKRKLIKLICKVKGVPYSMQKEKREDINITTKDIDLLVEKVLGIKVTVEK